jgi:hypothetical protein
MKFMEYLIFPYSIVFYMGGVLPLRFARYGGTTPENSSM